MRTSSLLHIGALAATVLYGLVLAPHDLSAQELRLSLEEAATDVSGTQIAYRIGGSGPPMILIHGGSRTGHDWDRYLDKLGAEFTVIVPELPGHGHSEWLPEGLSMQATARAMFGLLDHLGIGQIRGVGHSLGANTVLHMAAQQPERVEAMVLVAGGHRLMQVARDALVNMTLEDATPEQRDYFREQHPGGETQIRAIYREVRTLADNYDDFEFSSERLARILTKTLLVWGDRDPLNPVAIPNEMYEAMPNASLWVVPNQGHMPLWPEIGGSREVEATFAQVVIDFFKQ